LPHLGIAPLLPVRVGFFVSLKSVVLRKGELAVLVLINEWEEPLPAGLSVAAFGAMADKFLTKYFRLEG